MVTHAIVGSDRENRQLQLKLSQHCLLMEESVMHLSDHDERYRMWCCPSAESPPTQRRSIHASQEDGDDDDDDGEEDGQVTLQNYLPWNIDRLDQIRLPLDNIYQPPALATSQPFTVHVFMVDSGIDKHHRVFQDVNVKWSYAVPPYNVSDCNKHGTETASIVAGYVTGVVSRGSDGVESSANVVLHAISVVGCDGSGMVSDVVKGLTWIKNYGPGVGIISMSIGAPYSATLNKAVEDMVNAGYLVVAAAGNDNGPACQTSPPSAAGVIAVGATNENDVRSSYSNYDGCVDIFACGDNCYGAQMGTYNLIAASSGTSYSCPAYTGAVVRQMLRTGTANPIVASNQVLASATVGIVKNAGAGSNNRFLTVATTQSSNTQPQQPPPPPPVNNVPDNGVVLPPSNASKSLPVVFVLGVALIIPIVLFC